MSPEQRLEAGLQQLGLELPQSTCEQLLHFVRELMQWNKAYNLTAVRDADGMVIRHLLDSISVLPFVDNARCLDVGTGAGLPGMVLAIINPDQQWTLLDSNGKKTRFLTHARIALSLKNVTVVNARVEKWQNEHLFDGVISRAFTELSGYAEIVRPLCEPDGHIWAMVARRPDISVGDTLSGCTISAVTPLQVPFDDAPRHLVQLNPVT